jgi:GT2 family glycosyltransferase
MIAELGVVLVNWGNEAETLRCIATVRTWIAPEPGLLVVDNESTDTSRHALTGALRSDQLIASEANLGYAGGNNLAITQALSTGASFILLLNSDAAIPERDIGRLLDRMRESPDLGIVGPVLRERGNGSKTFHIGGRDIAWHAFTRAVASQEPAAKHPDGPLIDVDYVPGAVILVRRSVFEQIGLLDEQFFFSGEIADFCKRARDGGFRVCIDLESEARHGSSAASQGFRDTLYVYYSLRNRLLYAKKHYRSERGRYLARWLGLCTAELGKALVQGRLGKARAILLAVIHGCTNQFGDRNAAFL